MATKRTITAKRIPSNIAFAVSKQGKRFLIAAEYSEDTEHPHGIKAGDLAAVAIVYANTAQASIGRFWKQFNKKENIGLDVVAIDYDTTIAKKIMNVSIKHYNDNIVPEADESEKLEETDIFETEAYYSKQNDIYKKKKIKQAARRRKRKISAKKAIGETTSVFEGAEDEYYNAALEMAKKAGVKIGKRPIVKHSKTAKASIKSKTRVAASKKKTTKKASKKKVTKKKKSAKK